MLSRIFESCCQKAKQKALAELHKFDVFISYRQDADATLVELLYEKVQSISQSVCLRACTRARTHTRSPSPLFLSDTSVHIPLTSLFTDLLSRLYEKLSNLTIAVEGGERQCRVFWDVKSLKAGEPWEAGFLAAISSSKVCV